MLQIRSPNASSCRFRSLCGRYLHDEITYLEYGEYELEVAADGSSAVGSAKGQPDKWRKMTNLGVLGSDLKQYAEHAH